MVSHYFLSVVDELLEGELFWDMSVAIHRAIMINLSLASFPECKYIWNVISVQGVIWFLAWNSTIDEDVKS